MNNLSSSEMQILEIMRELRPFEVIKISKDKGGKANSYFIERSQKLFIEESAENLQNV